MKSKLYYTYVMICVFLICSLGMRHINKLCYGLLEEERKPQNSCFSFEYFNNTYSKEGLINYRPGEIGSLVGKIVLSYNYYYRNYSYGLIDDVETVGCITSWQGYISRNDALVFQFVAYTDDEEAKIRYVCGENEGVIELTHKPVYGYVYLEGTNEVQDFAFQCLSGGNIHIGDVYIVDYGKYIKKEELLLGIYK